MLLKEYGIYQNLINWANTTKTSTMALFIIVPALFIPVAFSLFDKNKALIIAGPLMSIFIGFSYLQLQCSIWEIEKRPFVRKRQIRLTNFSVTDIQALVSIFPRKIENGMHFISAVSFHRYLKRLLKNPIYSHFPTDHLVELYEIAFTYPLEDIPTLEPMTSTGSAVSLWRLKIEK